MTDLSPEEFAERAASLIQMHNANVAEYGWSSQGVFGTEDAPCNSFVYSIGIGLHGGFEFCVGGLNGRQGHMMLTYLYEWAVAGGRPEYNVDIDIGLLLPIRFAPMTDEHEMFATVRWYEGLHEGVTFTPVQALWPDKQGKCPGVEGMDPEFLEPQNIPGSLIPLLL